MECQLFVAGTNKGVMSVSLRSDGNLISHEGVEQFLQGGEVKLWPVQVTHAYVTIILSSKVITIGGDRRNWSS